MEFGSGEIVGRAEAETTGTKFGTKFLLLAGKALKLRFAILAADKAHQKSPEQAGDRCVLLGGFDARRPIEVVINADGNIFHGGTTLSQFHSSGKVVREPSFNFC